jgi:hypothetical protein
MKKKFIYLAFLFLAVTACKKDVEILKPGYFLLSEAQVISYDSVKSNFMLGDLKSSKEFLFIISNGGDNPIFNIGLKSDNSQFTVAPETIGTLIGNSSMGSGNYIQFITLGILHGTRLNGVGYTNLLPMGENKATLTITGNTVENGDTIQLETEYGITVNAQIMDISLYSEDQPIDMQRPQGLVMSGGNYGGLGNLRMYNVQSSTLVLINTGNVDISIAQPANSKTIDAISLPAFQSVTITLSEGITAFSLSSNGTITDDSRMQLGNDGKGYFAINKK